MQFANHAALTGQGRIFDCSRCPVKVMKLRRCEDERMDFGAEDGALWPMRIQEGGGFYGFCPAKATWDQEAVNLYNLLLLCFEMKQPLYSGGLAEQPSWFTELLSWFVPNYDSQKFYSRARAIIGDGKKQQSLGGDDGDHSRRTTSQNRPGFRRSHQRL